MFTDIVGFRSFIDIVLKITGILVSVGYVIYSLVIIRQVDSMKKVVELQDNGLLLFFSYIQLGVALLLFLYSLFIL